MVRFIDINFCLSISLSFSLIFSFNAFISALFAANFLSSCFCFNFSFCDTALLLSTDVCSCADPNLNVFFFSFT